MMKRLINLAIIFLTILSLISPVFALSSNIKQSYEGLETALVKLDGKIVEPLSISQIEFKRKNVVVPIQFDVKKVYETNYIWFVTPKVENETNYTLIIHDVFIEELGQNKKVDFYANFSVRPNITDYYITPGFVSTKENYTIVVNSNVDIENEINVDFPSKKEFTINPGKNEFEFSAKELDSSVFKITKFGDYSLPIYIIKEGNPQNVENDSLSISPQSIEYEREIGSKKLTYSFKVINIGANKVEDIALEYDDEYMEISPDSGVDLESGEEALYNITLEKEINISQTVKIYSKKNNITRYIPIDIKFTNFDLPINYTLINQTLENNNSGGYYCQELNGKECFEGQKCEGQLIKTRNDVSCCIGKCSLISEEKAKSSWIGYLIIGVALVAIAFAFVKYKKVKPSKTLLEKTLDEDKELKKNFP